MSLQSLSVAVGLVLVAVVVTARAQDEGAKKSPTPKLETAMEKAAYAIGHDIGRDLKKQGLNLDPKLLLAGITEALNGEESSLTPEEIQEAFAAVRKELAAKKTEASKKFLDEHKKKDGVKVTKSGLQYLVIKEGEGELPTKSSTVTAHYRGTLTNGEVFDQSYEGEAPTDNDEPRSFPVTRVIPGWTEALQMMKVGSHYRLVIPSELAYGENGPPGIGPNAVLVFEIYLVKSEG